MALYHSQMRRPMISPFITLCLGYLSLLFYDDSQLAQITVIQIVPMIYRANAW